VTRRWGNSPPAQSRIQMHLRIQTEAQWRGAPRFILTGKWASCFPALESGAPTTGMSMWQSSKCGCSPGLGQLGAGSALTATDALNQAISMYGAAHLNPAEFKNSAWLADAEAAISSATIPTSGGFGPQCSGQAASNINLFKTASGLAVGTTSAGIGIAASIGAITATTAAIAGAATLGVGALVAVIGLIFEHHAAAVQRALSFGCSTYPAVNNSFALINQGVQQGTISPAAAAQALQEIYSQFMQAGGASGSASGPGNIPSGGQAINDSPWCNSNCELSVVLLGMVLYWEAQYAAMQQPATAATTPAQAETGVSSPSTTPGTLVSVPSSAPVTPGTLVSMATGQAVNAPPAAPAVPSWMWLAAAAVGAFLLFK